MFVRSFCIIPASPGVTGVPRPFFTGTLHSMTGHQRPAPDCTKSAFKNQDNKKGLLLTHFLHMLVFGLPCRLSPGLKIFCKLPVAGGVCAFNKYGPELQQMGLGAFLGE